jgi:hypothetical protein
MNIDNYKKGLFSVVTISLLLIVSVPDVDAGVSVVGDLTHIKKIEPGERSEDIILLKNTESTSIGVKVYQTDYLFYSDGRTLYDNPGSHLRSNALWVTLGRTQIVIPPQTTFSLYYTIQAPRDAGLSGTYWSMIMVEQIPVATDEAKKTGKGTAVTTIMRYGIQIITEIGNTGTNNLKFLNKKLIQEDGKTLLQLDAENSGEKWYIPQVSCDLYNTEGAFVKRYECEKVRIFPTCSVRYQIPLDVSKGKYKGLILFDVGNNDIFGAEYDMEIK